MFKKVILNFSEGIQEETLSLVKAVVMYECESWTIKKAEC